ncbi:hypothetical protein [Nocardiopsis xinjiangensis]|uniref:hypothetical protein n=1 Tax=Nocardiopsis xinjiangensis TaxID=124285 RepID=UPI0003475FC2|nr:hypothetical protein [Nocardiopsis xinjiangensis]
MDTPPTPTERHRALIRLTERHATGPAHTRWSEAGLPLTPYGAVRRVGDLADALTLLPHARAEFDQRELGLLTMAKGRGMTWQRMGQHLGLGSAQAARQRHPRLTERLDT